MYTINYGMLMHGRRFNGGREGLGDFGKLTKKQQAKRDAKEAAQLHAIYGRIETKAGPSGNVQVASKKDIHALAVLSKRIKGGELASIAESERILLTKPGRSAIMTSQQLTKAVAADITAKDTAKATSQYQSALDALNPPDYDAQFAAERDAQAAADLKAAQDAWNAAHPYTTPTYTGDTSQGQTAPGATSGGGGSYQSGVAAGEDGVTGAGTADGNVQPATPTDASVLGGTSPTTLLLVAAAVFVAWKMMKKKGR